MANTTETYTLYRYGITLPSNVDEGVVVVNVVDGSGADKGGLKAGDVIVKMFDITLYVDTVESMMQGMFLVCLEDDGLLFLVETQNFHDHPRTTGDLFQFLAISVEKV